MLRRRRTEARQWRDPPRDRVFSQAGSRERACRGLDVSHAVEFSKTVPPGLRKKASDSRRRPSDNGIESYPFSLKGSPCRVAGTFHAASCRGGWAMIATVGGVSSGPEAHELALSSLDDGARQALARNLDRADDVAVDLDGALIDQPPDLAVRAEGEVLDEQRRQVDRVVRRQDGLRNSLRRPVLAHDAREVLLRSLRSFLSVPLRHDGARERQLRLHRLSLRRVGAE